MLLGYAENQFVFILKTVTNLEDFIDKICLFAWVENM